MLRKIYNNNCKDKESKLLVCFDRHDQASLGSTASWSGYIFFSKVLRMLFLKYKNLHAVDIVFIIFFGLLSLSPASASDTENRHLADSDRGIKRDCDICSQMVVIPKGDYLMGATQQEFNEYEKYRYMYFDEAPQQLQRVKSFRLAKFDVTKRQFAIFAKETGFQGKGCQILRNHQWILDPTADWEHPGFEQTDQDPVVCVSWNDANKFITWLNAKKPKTSNIEYRLPTEVEWEYAARAGTLTPRYWGSNNADQCRYENTRDIAANNLDRSAPFVDCNDGYVETSPVGSFKPNPWGLFDMLGDVSQWMQNCSSTIYSISRNYLGGDNISCKTKALRGASWAGIPAGVRAAFRGGAIPSSRDSGFGFRLAADFNSAH